MAIRDFESFLRERAVRYDPNIDTSPGSPFDTEVIQPILRRLGTDPFTVDVTTFINNRLTQAFPDLATGEGDVVTDLLSKPASVLLDPITREIKRVSNNLSWRDPSTLTVDEAESLGANLFTPIRRGKLARLQGRLFFNAPQNVDVSPANFCTSKGGLHFFPSGTQSIRTAEMILNVTSDNLYYFDVNLIAEAAGSQYNIGPNELISVANLPSVVRVTNLRRVQEQGEDAETAASYVGRAEQSLSERSLVTLRGASAKTLEAFPEVNRLNIVGFNDPEMQRDIIKGGGLGPMVRLGTQGLAVPDGEGKLRTRRFAASDANDFTLAITGDATDWVLTVFGAFGPTPVAVDLNVRAVISATELDVEEQIMLYGPTPRAWTLRKKELTLSSIPGGILFPDTANGTLSIPNDEIHIGGAFDLHVRGTGFEESTFTIQNVTDDNPLLRGTRLSILGPATVQIDDFILNSNYSEDDETYATFRDAASKGWTLQILEGVDAGNYRVTFAQQSSGQPVYLIVDPVMSNFGTPTTFRWRLFDDIDIDLISPKETRIDGTDLRTVQGTDLVDTVSGVNFEEYGAVEGDTLRILNGPDAGDYTLLQDPIPPSFDKLQVDRVLTHSAANLQYVVFRPNAEGGVQLPLIRITKMELLDSSSQPIGSIIPYARPVDIQSQAFQNSGRGVKHDLRDVRLGIVSRPGPYVTGPGTTLRWRINGVNVMTNVGTLNPTAAQVVTNLNAQILAATGIPSFAELISAEYFGIRPVALDVALIGGSAQTAIFGNTEYRSTRDVRSPTVELLGGGWEGLSPRIETDSRLDVLQVLDGVNAGIYEAPYVLSLDVSGTFPGTGISSALVVAATDTFTGFAPAILRHVQIGARSLGSVRVFFLEPTSFEVDTDTVFTLETASGTLEYLPDPTLEYQLIPAQPSVVPVMDAFTNQGSAAFSSLSQDFIKSNVRPGDVVEILNHPISGDAVLPSPVPNLVNKTFIFSLDGGPDRTLTFIRDDVSLGPAEVTRAGVAEQINAAAGTSIVTLQGTNTLEFDTSLDLVIRAEGTANPIILGNIPNTFPVQTYAITDQSNKSPHAKRYTVVNTGLTTLTLDQIMPSPAPFLGTVTRQTYKVYRSGVQRIPTTAMALNTAEAGLFYFDVELISRGTGDQWNIDRGLQLKAEGYRSDGYYLATKDPNLSFSPVESISLVLSRSILDNGVDDDPANATLLSGQNLQITYERAPLVNDVQNFISSDVERVVCASPLSRHLIPHFVRFDATYTGGSRESVTAPEIGTYIENIFPQGALESSEIQKILHNRGATSIKNPLDLIAIVHYPDRSVYAARSQDRLTTGRLAAFIADRVTVKRNIT